MQTLIAELWRRAGRFDDALAACDAADAELADAALDDDEERSGAAAVAAFVRALAEAGDDGGRSCAEAFAGDE